MIATKSTSGQLMLCFVAAFSMMAVTEMEEHSLDFPTLCNFETSGYCFWQSNYAKGLYWNHMRGSENNSPYGPFMDRTFQTDKGRFLILYKSNHRKHCSERKTLHLTRVKIPPQGMCLTFWYYMNGDDTLNLNLRIDIWRSSKIIRRSKRGSLGPDWRHMQVDIDNSSRHAYISFTASMCSKTDASLALDDIGFTLGSCPIRHDCDFDDGLCGYTQSSSDERDWFHVKPKEEENGTGAMKPSMGGAFGGYAHVNSSSSIKSGENAVLFSPVFTLTKPVCFRFWYNVKASTNLKVLESTGAKKNRTVWSRDGESPDEWHLGMVTVQGHPPYRLAIQASFDGSEQSVSLDSVDTLPGLCHDTLTHCDFEDTACSWYNDPAPGYSSWVRTGIGKAENGYVVRTDHTLGTKYGKYLLLNRTSTRKRKERMARFISPPLAPRSAFCLNFWYVIVGRGKITIKLKSRDSEVDFHRITSHQETRWEPFRQTIKSLDFESLLIVEGDINGSKQSQIYLDDLFLQLETCEESPASTHRKIFQCSESNVTLPGEKICDFRDDCLGGEDETICGYNCDFEDNNCKWKDTSYENKLWITTSSNELNGTIGPDNDHTAKDNLGQFMYIHDSYSYMRHIILSPLLKRASDDCNLVFYVRVSKTQAWFVTVNKIVGDRSVARFGSNTFEENTWIKVVASVGHSLVPFHIEIEVQSRWARNQLFALDDISFKDCDFQQLSHSLQPSQSIFQCTNGFIIKREKVCNFVNDCVDNSDEAESLCSTHTRCTFENHMCSWTQESLLDDANWTRATADSCKRYPYIGPEYDHTTALSSGSVVKFAGWGGKPGDRVWLVSPVLQPSENCRLTFHLYLQSGRNDLFQVFTRHKKDGLLHLHMSTTGGPGKFWSLRSVALSSSGPFQIVLEGVKGNGWYVEIAVDDISMSPDCKLGHWETTTTTSTNTTTTTTTTTTATNATTGTTISSKTTLTATTSANNTISPTTTSTTYSGKLPLRTTAEPRTTTPTTPAMRNTTTPSTNLCSDPEHWLCHDQSLCLHKSQRCDFQTQCKDQSDEIDCGHCDFENSTCGWTDRSTGIFIWGKSSASFTKLTDNDIIGQNESNAYMSVLDAGNGFSRDAFLVSPIFGGTSPTCSMTFLYLDSYTESLSLYLYSEDSTSYGALDDGHFLWQSTTAYPSWRLVTISVDSLAPGFKLVFKSFIGHRTPPAVIAIDDVQFSSTCGDNDSWTWCKTDEFLCRNTSECKSRHAVCDLTQDCPHGDDEADCDAFRFCNFYDRRIFAHDESSDFKWMMQKPDPKNNEPMPPFDHTRRDDEGWYLYMNAKSIRNNAEKARVISYIMHPTSKGDCYMRFYYWSVGDVNGFVNIYTTTETGEKTPLWTMSQRKAENWTKVVLPLKSQHVYGIVIEGIRHNGYQGGIAIDDVTLSPECYFDDRYKFKVRTRIRQRKRFQSPCVLEFQNSLRNIRGKSICPSKCGFENGMCGWYQRLRKKSISWATEPLSFVSNFDTRIKPSDDHILMVGSEVGKYGKRPRLLHSPIITNAANGCTFSFQYYYVGNISIFYISLRTTRGMQKLHYEGADSDERKSRSGSWNEITVAIPSCSGESRIVIYLFLDTKNVQKSYFMIDNMTFSDCLTTMQSEFCPFGYSLCDNGRCVPESQLCDLENDCCDWSDESAGRCSEYTQFTFEHGLSGWKHDVTTRYKWFARKGWRRRGRYNFGRPASDHTTLFRHGHYLSTTKQIGKAKKAVILYQMEPLSDYCEIAFWYQMNCVHRNSCLINVYTKTLSGPQNLVQTFKSNSKALKWEKGIFTILIRERFQIRLEGLLDDAQYSTLNVDDIIFSPNCVYNRKQKESSTTMLQPSKSYVTCNQSDVFQCFGDGLCIQERKRCDFHVDCHDGSDENGCHTNTVCDFDTDTCNWWSYNSTSFTWKPTYSLPRQLQRALSLYSFGAVGHYMFLSHSGLVRKENRVPDLNSQRFNGAMASCLIRFDYYLPGSGSCVLSLGVSLQGGGISTLWQTTRSASYWQEAVVGIGKRNSSFSLIFRVSSKSAETIVNVAIDRVQYDNCGSSTGLRSKCDNDDFECQSGFCINKMLVCNHQNDCEDGSDESLELCRRYSVINFDDAQPLHRFVQSTKDRLDWQISSRSSYHGVEGLTGIDHSTWSSDGHYLFVLGTSNTSSTDKASIVTRTYVSTNTTCMIRIHVLIPSRSQSVYVSYITGDDDSSGSAQTMALDKELTEFGTFWQPLSVSTSVTHPFRLVITGVPGGPGGAVAIDDIIFGPGCTTAR